MRLPRSEKTLTLMPAPAVGHPGAGFFLARFTYFPRVTSSSASNLPCRGLGTTGTTTTLDLVRLVDAPLALVKPVGFFYGGIRC